MKAVLISGGNPPSFNLLNKYNKGYYIIAADSGTNVLFKYKIKPDLIIGDLDSIDKEVLDFYIKMGVKFNKFPKKKNFSDTALCALEAIEKGASEISVLGATGGRSDHFIANINLLYFLNDKNIKGKIEDDYNEIFLINSPFETEGEKGTYFSVFSLGEDTSVINIENCRYPLNKYHLLPRDSLILSNEFNEEPLKITFNKGPLIFIKSWDKL